MKFTDHSELLGAHAFLSPSRYHWTNYTKDKLVKTYLKWDAIQRGTDIHKLASDLINFKIRLPKTKNALNRFVNDAIGFRMISEQPLFYSVNCFGTADAIVFQESKKILKIHDLKTGISRVYVKQLEIYAALFFLEYEIDPKEIDVELRIYQGNEVIEHFPESDDIISLMNKIIEFDLELEKIKKEAE